MPCPYCYASKQQIRSGFNRSGSQRYQCKRCQRRYTPNPKEAGYPPATREQAIRLHAEGNNFRQIARLLNISHATVMNWVKAHADQLPAAPMPAERPHHIIEMDELHTFVGDKKTDGT